jgi:O-antigen/teichoic acid export membrane protein
MSLGSAAAQRWHNAYGLVRGDRVLTHNVIVAVGTITAGVMGVAFQSVISHSLRPADYGEVFAVVTLITLIGLPATALTLLMARETSRDHAHGLHVNSAALLHSGNRALIQVGLALTAAFVLVSPALASFLNVPMSLLWAAAAGMPFGLALPLLIGEFQGEQHFLAFAILSSGQAALKLIAAISLGFVYGSIGVIAGISLATFVVYAIARWMLRRKLSIKPNVPWLRPAVAYLMVIVPSTLALGVLLSADVLLVKHFFASGPAGEYAAVAALGRAIFWGASGVATVLFPKVIAREALGRSGSPIVGASLILVTLGGLVGLGLISFGSSWLLTAFAGQAYSGATGYLPWYALGMTLLGAATVLIMTQQSRGKPWFLAILIPLTVLEPALLSMFHESLMQVVLVLDISMALLFVGLATQFALQQRIKRGPTGAATHTEELKGPSAAQIPISR